MTYIFSIPSSSYCCCYFSSPLIHVFLCWSQSEKVLVVFTFYNKFPIWSEWKFWWGTWWPAMQMQFMGIYLNFNMVCVWHVCVCNTLSISLFNFLFIKKLLCVIFLVWVWWTVLRSIVSIPISKQTLTFVRFTILKSWQILTNGCLFFKKKQSLNHSRAPSMCEKQQLLDYLQTTLYIFWTKTVCKFAFKVYNYVTFNHH